MRPNYLVLLVLALPSVASVLPTGILSLSLLPQSPHDSPSLFDHLCSPSASAGWGEPLSARVDSRWKPLVQLPASNRDGCALYELQGDNAVSVQGAVILVDRGNCSFVSKALKAQAAGATGLIVRGTKRAVYEAIISHNTTNTSAYNDVPNAGPVATILPVIDKPVFEYDCSRGEAFVDKLATPVWLTDSKQCSDDARCSSKSCVLTGHVTVHESNKQHQVCCMWDTVVLMGATNRTRGKELMLHVVYVTISDGKKLQTYLDKYSTSLVARTYRREVPLIDVSTLLMWALAVATTLGAAYYSTGPMRNLDRCDVNYGQQMLHDDQNTRDENRRIHARDDTVNLDTRHAVGFIALSGVFLTVLYYVKIGGAIPVLFAVSGTVALTQVVGAPVVEWLVPDFAFCEVKMPLLGEVARLSEILGVVPSVAVAVVWYLHRRTYWALQDIMGISLCFLFLRTIQLPNLKVATLLLTLSFGYDVFFVFLSPIFFGSSVMEDVATGGPAAYTKSGYPGVDYCERYPHYSACVDPEPMPMLLVLPRIMDWVQGVSMLGLGDIILPGMLLSFTRQYDYARGTTKYFRIVAVGDAIGLALANLAVMMTNVGQPALMYLVPTTLGSLIIVSKRNGDFDDMWSGAGLDEKRSRRNSSEALHYSAVDLKDQMLSGDLAERGYEQSNEGDLVPLLRS